MKYEKDIETYNIESCDSHVSLKNKPVFVFLSYESGKLDHALLHNGFGRDYISNPEQLKNLLELKENWHKTGEMYSIICNDGSGPFSTEVVSVTLSYERGKPEYASLGHGVDIEKAKKVGSHSSVHITDSEKLEKIVEFFNQ